MRLFVLIVLALMLHLLIGWEASIGAGVLAGLWESRSGWWKGGLAVGTSWALLLFYNAWADGPAMLEMMRVMGELFGGLSPSVVLALSLVLGSALGALGGMVGLAARSLRTAGRAPAVS